MRDGIKKSKKKIAKKPVGGKKKYDRQEGQPRKKLRD